MSSCTVFVFLSLIEYAFVNVMMGDISEVERKDKTSQLRNIIVTTNNAAAAIPCNLHRTGRQYDNLQQQQQADLQPPHREHDFQLQQLPSDPSQAKVPKLLKKKELLNDVRNCAIKIVPAQGPL